MMKTHKPLIALFLTLPLFCGAADFVKVKGVQFTRDNKPYYFIGANFWQGMNLGSKGPGGDRAKLVRELDRLQAMGITNLRIMAASEGPDTEPWRMVPALQKSPGVYDEAVMDGLDFFISELGARNMTAVVTLNNFWPWSGGMAQYVSWHGGGAIPYPPPAEGGDWGKFQKYSAQFYSNKAAVKNFRDVVKTLITRMNPYTQRSYADEPAIMAWQLANEPRGSSNTKDFNIWISETASFIKSLDRNHLVTVGSEGDTPSPVNAGNDFIKNHSSPNIDYATIHIWVTNWDWFDPLKKDETYPVAVRKMKDYFKSHVERATTFGKPVVLEEFGIGRAGGSYDPKADVVLRDQFYKEVFNEAYQSAKIGSPLAGVAFWAWAGENRPPRPGAPWKPGDPWLGDPPHEFQGWYSVYDCDTTTVKVITEFAAKFNALSSTEK
jgi:mannan endo-1,4-beta-mannosidase